MEIYDYTADRHDDNMLQRLMFFPFFFFINSIWGFCYYNLSVYPRVEFSKHAVCECDCQPFIWLSCSRNKNSIILD